MTTQRRRRRSPGQGSIRKRANGTWEARITIARVARSFYGRTRAEALAQIASASPRAGRADWSEKGLRELALAQGITAGSWRKLGMAAPFWPKDLDPEDFVALIEDADTPAVD